MARKKGLTEMSEDSSSKQGPDLEAIEERMVLYERGIFRGSTYDDIAALLAHARQQDARITELEADVKGLREEKADLEQALHVAPVKAQLAIANHIFMTDAGLCLEVIAPLAHTELIKVGQQILEGVGQYDIQSQLEAEVKRLREETARYSMMQLAAATLLMERLNFKSLPHALDALETETDYVEKVRDGIKGERPNLKEYLELR
jgi:hypothetical protein